MELFETKSSSIKTKHKVFLIQLVRLVLVIFISCCFSSQSLLAQTNLPEQNKYIRRQYMFIPWGEGKDAIPLNQAEVPDKNGQQHLFSRGPDKYWMDGDGNIYLVAMDVSKKKILLKKFNKNGDEVASAPLEMVPDYLRFDGKKIILDVGYTNQICVLNQDLKTEKTIDVPKDFRVENSDYENGMLFKSKKYLSRKEREKYFVIDRDEWGKAGKPEHLKLLFDKFNLETEGILKSPDLYLSTDPTDETKKTKIWHVNSDVENIWSIGLIGVDNKQNVYVRVVYRTPINNSDVTLLKISSRGKLLAEFHFQTEEYPLKVDGSALQSVESGDPLMVDDAGDFYTVKDNEKGVHIDIYKYQNF